MAPRSLGAIGGSLASGRMIKGISAGLLGAALMLTGPVVAQAASPLNDNFAAATPLAVGDEISSLNVDATVETGEPEPNRIRRLRLVPQHPSAEANCSAPARSGTFQPASSGQYTIGTCDGGTDVYDIVGVYTGAPSGP